MSREYNFDPQLNAQYNAVAGYRTYAIGVSVLSNPDETFRIHGGDIETKPSGIIDLAKSLMIFGLSNVVRYSNPAISSEKLREKSLESLQEEFYGLVPNMRIAVDVAFEDKKFTTRLDQLSPIISIVRPAPMCVEGIYKNICKSRKGKLKVANLMMGIPLDKRFSQATIDSPVNPLPQFEAANFVQAVSNDDIEEVLAQLDDSLRHRGFPGSNN